MSLIPETTVEHIMGKAGLKYHEMGGGVDHLIKPMHDAPCPVDGPAIVVTDTDLLDAPKSITDPCVVTVYPDYDWNQGVEIHFPCFVSACEFIRERKITVWSD